MVVVAVGQYRPRGDREVLADEHVVDAHLREQVVEVRPARRWAVGRGGHVAGVFERTPVRERVPLRALVGRFADDAVEVARHDRRSVADDIVEAVEDEVDAFDPRPLPVVIEVGVQAHERLVGVSVPKPRPGRDPRVARVPADAAGLARALGEPEGFGLFAGEALGSVADGRVLAAGVDAVAGVADPLVARQQRLQFPELMGHRLLDADHVRVVVANDGRHQSSTMRPPVQSVPGGVVPHVVRHHPRPLHTGPSTPGWVRLHFRRGGERC